MSEFEPGKFNKRPEATKTKEYKLDKSRLLNSQNHYLTRSLFHELGEEGIEPVFTLKPYHIDGAHSLHRLYVDIGDPTEYEQAIQLLGSWEHWQLLCEALWFQDPLAKMRSELAIKLKSQAIAQIRTDGKKAFSEATRLAANKFITLLESANASQEVSKEKNPVGRPRKQDDTLNEATRMSNCMEEDFLRIIPLGTTRGN